MFSFRSMNTDIQVIACDDEEGIAAEVAATFAAVENRFSRFREDSELSALNRTEGPFIASPELFEILARARVHCEMTDGLFDPGIGATLRALGYDRSFSPGALDRERVSAAPRRGIFRDVVLEHQTRTVWRPRDVQIDLGGVAKGVAVDLASRHLRGPGVVNAGGDAFMRGSASSGDGWLVDVEDPADPSRTLATIVASDTAVATSAGNRRRWRVGNGFVHHLIDPRTQDSSSSDLLQATVLAASAELADVLAKTALLLGARAGGCFLQRQPGCIGAVLAQKSDRPLFIGALDVREVARA